MKYHEKKESIKNKKTSLKEKFRRKPKKKSVSAEEYEAKMRKERIKSGIPCAF